MKAVSTVYVSMLKLLVFCIFISEEELNKPLDLRQTYPKVFFKFISAATVSTLEKDISSELDSFSIICIESLEIQTSLFLS